MLYNQSTVIIGGLVHVPILIIILRLIENRFKKNDVEYKKN